MLAEILTFPRKSGAIQSAMNPFPVIAALGLLASAEVAVLRAQLAPLSVNAVGYSHTTLAPGFNLISNPLNAANNQIQSLFGGIAGLPDGLRIYFLGPEGFEVCAFDALTTRFLPEALGQRELPPGKGVFVLNPARQSLTVTFVGEVPQGRLVNELPAGFSLVASMVPQAGTAEQLGFAGEQGDYIYTFSEALQKYHLSACDDIEQAWLPGLPILEAGKAFLLYKKNPGEWVRTFFIIPQ